MGSSKQTTLAGFFGKPKPGAAPSRPSSALSQTPSQTQAPPTARPPGQTSSQTRVSSAASPASSSTLKTPSSVVGSSPYPGKEKERKRAGSPLKQSTTVDNFDDGSLSPPPEAEVSVRRSSPQEKEDEKMDVDNEGGGSRRAKRKVVYAESGSDSEDDVPLVRGAKGKSETEHRYDYTDQQVGNLVKASRKNQTRTISSLTTMMMLPCVSLELVDVPRADSLVAAAEEYEASAATSPSIQGSSPAPVPKKKSSKVFTAPKAVKPSLSTSSSSGPSRPAPRPLANSSHSARSASASDNFLLTAAERQRILTEETKRENEQCFDFLKPENVKDKEGNRPDHPDYDGRTILVPKSAWSSFTPFEKQFWEIKQDHFDTVLFFQKGKFYELYEDDALIGHQEFDLKLTDRVKMKMVSRFTSIKNWSDWIGRCPRAEFRLVGVKVPSKRL